MKRSTGVAFAVSYSLLALGFAKTTYNNLVPISPKPHTGMEFGMPVRVKSLRPVFKWQTTSPDLKTDLGIWEAICTTGKMMRRSNGDCIQIPVRGERVYYKEGIVGGEHQVEKDLAPGATYYWSVKPNGTTDWATYGISRGSDKLASIGLSGRTQIDGLFFLIKTPKN